MLTKKTRRLRSLSFSYAATGRCRHSATASTPLGSAEAEHLLRKAPLKPAPIKEDVENECDGDVGGNGPEEDKTRAAIKTCLSVVPPLAESPSEELRVTRLLYLTAGLRLSQAHLLHIERRLLHEIGRGLCAASHDKADVKSFATYVHRLPTGRERGRFLALDLGGTNFRVILVELEEGSRSVRMKSHKHEVSQAVMLGCGEGLFDFMASKLHHFLLEHSLLNDCNDDDGVLHLGFTFSFPTRQQGLARAHLAHWTKGYVCEGVEGRDVASMMNDAIARRQSPELTRRVSVDVVLNDTTGCLLACAFKRPECAIGIILGTGTNACYVEEMDNLEVYGGPRPPGETYVLVNTEWGAFGTDGSLEIVRTRYDKQLDASSRNPGKQIYEKMVGGMYLGEMGRLVLLHAVEEGIILTKGVTEEAVNALSQPGIVESRHLSEIEADPTRQDLSAAHKLLVDDLGLPASAVTSFDLRAVRHIAECVTGRAADLSGAGVAALINKTRRRRVTVGMDGSLYKFHPWFGRRMRRTAACLVCDCVQFELVLSEDGSGRGAALAAAVAVKQSEAQRC